MDEKKALKDAGLETCAYALDHETWDEAISAGMFNRRRVLSAGGDIWPISAGDSDDVSVYRFTDTGTFIVISVNERHGYAGLQEFTPGEPEVGAEVFLEGEDFAAYTQDGEPGPVDWFLILAEYSY